MRPTFTSRDVLQRVAGVPVIGAITAVVQAGILPWYRRQGVLVGAAVSLLLVVFVLNLVLSDSLRAVLRTVAG